MICPFCKKELQSSSHLRIGSIRIDDYFCGNTFCWPNDFPKYKCSKIVGQDELLKEEYALNGFYVKVHREDNSTKIFKLLSSMLFDEVKVPRAIWLNPTNFEATLDKLKFCVIFS